MLFWLAAGAFASMVSMRICDPMLPALAADFGTTPAGAAGVVTLYTLGYGVSQLVHGSLGDRIGKARYIAGAALVAAAASLACALAPGLRLLEIARLATGAVAAAIIPLAMAWISDTVDYGARQTTLAKFLNGVIVGIILGQSMGGMLADTLGWRSAFLLLAIVFALTGWQLGVRAARANPGSPAATADTPMLERYVIVLRAPWARAILALVAVEGLLVFGALAFVPTSLHERAGLPVWLAGATMASFGVGGFFYTASAARLVRSLGEPGLATAGGLLLAAGFALVALLPGAASGVVACIMLGLGYYMLHSTLQTHATQMAPAARGTAVALFAMSLFLGQSAGVTFVAGALSSAGYAALFGMSAAGLALIGLVFAALLRRRTRQADGPRRERRPGAGD